MTTEQMSTTDSETTGQETGAKDTASSNAGGEDSVLWESRFKGLNAKHSEIVTQATKLGDENATLKQRLADLESGKTTADEAANARVKEMEATLAAERKARAVDVLKIEFPETFSVFGETAAEFSRETLAASEARLGAGESPADDLTPRKHNESRSATRAPAKEESADDVKARLISMKVPWG